MNSILELLAGLALIYFLLSMLVSAIVELFQTRMKSRGKQLYDAMTKVFNDRNDRNWGELIYQHPLVENLKKDFKSPPSYIGSSTFANTIVDLVVNNGKEKKVEYSEEGMPLLREIIADDSAFTQFDNGLKKFKEGEVRSLLQSLQINSDDLEGLKMNLMKWYEDYMDRVSGWYKRSLKKSLFVASLIVSLALNVDTIRVVQTLWQNDDLRTELYTVAANVASDSTSLKKYELLPAEERLDSLKAFVNRSDAILKTLELQELPLGWITDIDGSFSFKKLGGLICENWKASSLQTLIGWLITALLLMQGAPFWFEVLKKFVNLRGSGPKPEPETS